MVMTSDAVRNDLARIETLIAMLRASYPDADDMIDDLYWLAEQKKQLQTLLALRRNQCGRRIVSLALWRDGSVEAPAKARAA